MLGSDAHVALAPVHAVAVLPPFLGGRVTCVMETSDSRFISCQLSLAIVNGHRNAEIQRYRDTEIHTGVYSHFTETADQTKSNLNFPLLWICLQNHTYWEVLWCILDLFSKGLKNYCQKTRGWVGGGGGGKGFYLTTAASLMTEQQNFKKMET